MYKLSYIIYKRKGYESMEIEAINKRISQLCKIRGMSYYRLAKESGLSESVLSSIRRKNNLPSLDTLEKICKSVNITMSEFFNSELFETSKNSKELYIALWQELSIDDKEKVLIYMHGLLHKQIHEKDIKNDL